MKDSAGVWFPPPLIPGAFLALAAALQRFLPLPQPARAIVGVPAGACVVVSVLVSLAALGLFFAAHENPLPETSTHKLVLRGPYRFSRNPMYLAMVLLYLGLGLWWACLWTLVFVPLVVWVMSAYVIRREERYLAGKFGDDYRTYCARVRRWL